MKNLKRILVEGHGKAAQRPVGPWRVPAELARHTPRPVSLSAGGFALAGVIALLLVAAPVTAALLWAASEDGRSLTERIAREGVWTTATILHSRQEQGENRRRFIGFEYRAGDSVFAGHATVGRFGPGRVGDVVSVRYLPDDPATAWVAGYEPGGPPIALVVLIPASLVMMAGMCAIGLRRNQRLLAEGRAVEARVVASKRASHGHGGHSIEYEFRVLSGAARRVKLEARKTPPPAGSVVTMLYDGDNPKRCAVYPLSLVRVSA